MKNIEIVVSWDIDAGCPISDIIKGLRQARNNYTLNNGGYAQTVALNETVYMVASRFWLDQDCARAYVMNVLGMSI